MDIDPLRFQRKVYRGWRASVKARGVACLLTFDEWWSLWAPHWADRMEFPCSLALGRIGDVGPYAIGNVYICSNGRNAHDAAINRALRAWPPG